jgi:hypothetical protein
MLEARISATAAWCVLTATARWARTSPPFTRESAGRCHWLVDRIEFGLRAGLDTESATDLLLMFGSSSTYLTLRRYGWSHRQYIAWLTATLAQQLLAQPERS